MIRGLVTVVIPVYNVEEYLDRCVASVVGQTYRNLEIILVDDGSTDDTMDIIRSKFFSEAGTVIL